MPQNWEKIFATYVTDKRLVSTIHKQTLQTDQQKTEALAGFSQKQKPGYPTITYKGVQPFQETRKWKFKPQ